MSAQIEQQTLDLANLRRKAPAETSQRFQDSFVKRSEEYDARSKEDEDAKLNAARNTTIDVGETERLDEMQNTWSKGSDQLLALKSGLGSTVAKMEKAQKAVGVVEEK